MDNAFSRRFLFKIEFEKPDKNARKLIWKDKLKNLKDNQYGKLSEYNLTGAQIENISKKHLLNSVFKKSKSGLSNLTNQDLKHLIDEEIKFKKQKGQQSIGF
jgi:SpoVK/Ycf46/Vps4 family AAA+-type ATPase